MLHVTTVKMQYRQGLHGHTYRYQRHESVFPFAAENNSFVNPIKRTNGCYSWGIDRKEVAREMSTFLGIKRGTKSSNASAR